MLDTVTKDTHYINGQLLAAAADYLVTHGWRRFGLGVDPATPKATDIRGAMSRTFPATAEVAAAAWAPLCPLWNADAALQRYLRAATNDWNDDPARTQEEVVMTLKLAAAYEYGASKRLNAERGETPSPAIDLAGVPAVQCLPRVNITCELCKSDIRLARDKFDARGERIELYCHGCEIRIAAHIPPA